MTTATTTEEPLDPALKRLTWVLVLGALAPALDTTIIGIGNYGYDWHGTEYAESLNFQDAVLAARDSEADIDFDDATALPAHAASEGTLCHKPTTSRL